MSLFDGPKFKNGEWVIIVDHLLEAYGGFVKDFDDTDGTYFVQITARPNGESTRAHVWVEENQLLSDEEVDLDEMQISCLLDMALDTKDQDWFNELSEQLNLSTRV